MASPKSLLCPTPAERLLDGAGRPYFLWDVDIDLGRFRANLESPDVQVRAYWAAKLMRQAKPDDVFSFLGWKDIDALWSALERHLGRSRAFWAWLREKHDEARRARQQ